MNLHRPTRALWRDETGGPAVEFGFIAMFLIFITFAVLEFGFILYQYNSAEKATQMGARLAATSWPVAQGLESVDCRTSNNTIPFGDPCQASDNFGVVTCNSGGCACSGGLCPAEITGTLRPSTDPNCIDAAGLGTVSGTEFGCIVQRMRGVYPFITPANVEIIYRDIPELRFKGRGYIAAQNPSGGVVPEIEVRVINLGINLFIAGPIVGIDTLTMPTIRSTLVGEDMNSGGQT